MPTLPDSRLSTQRSSFARVRSLARGVLLRRAVLVAADIGVVTLLWLLLRRIRELAPFLEQMVLPQGSFGGVPLVAAVLLGLVLMGAYGEGDEWRSWTPLLRGVSLGAGMVHWQSVWGAAPLLGLLRWGIIVVLLGVSLGVSRSMLSRIVAGWRSAPERRAAAILVGPEDDIALAAESRIFAPSGPYRVGSTLALEDLQDADDLAGTLLAAIGDGHASTIILVGYVTPEVWNRIVEITDAAGCRLLSVARHGGPPLTALRQVSYAGFPVTQITTPHLRYPQLVLKRAFDVLVSLALIVLLSPLFFIIAVAVRLSSPGPALFRQERVGLGGRRFHIYKFRSMRQGAEQDVDSLRSKSVYGDPLLFKVPDDPRVTRFGHFLRKTSLDELPQFFNVVTGEMSLVGPRPPLPSEVVLYKAHHFVRFDVKPGITGPWQVSGRNEVLDFEDVILLEQEYIRNWSLGRDLRIMFETIPAVVGGKGAM